MAYMTENGTKFVHENEVLSYDSDRQGNVKLSSLQGGFRTPPTGTAPISAAITSPCAKKWELCSCWLKQA